MLLRIDVDRRGPVTVLRLHGGLAGDGLDEFQRTVGACAGEVELDLAQLLSLDPVSTAYLQGLVHAGVRVRGANPYLQSLLPPPVRERP